MLDPIIVNNLTKSIIEHQQMIVGPIALAQANKVSGLKAEDGGNITIELKGDPKNILTDLVKKYEEIFGLASVEVCKDAVKEVKPPIPPEELPEILR